MMHALVLEIDSASCNSTSAVLGSLGYLVTPVFRPKKALLAAQLIPFDLIFIHTTAIPDDRRSLASELKRCSPLSFIALIIEPGAQSCERVERDSGSVDAILRRPLNAQALRAAIAQTSGDGAPCISRRRILRERRQWSVV